jgi:GntR family transcriptional regulator
MFERLDSRSPTPLYDQIAARIRVAVAAGDLNAGDALPSVRQMASRLRVNPATVVQAYRALEVEGFLEMRQGAGTFVNSIPAERRDAERNSVARRLVQQLLIDAARVGLPRASIVQALRQEIGEA